MFNNLSTEHSFNQNLELTGMFIVCTRGYSGINLKQNEHLYLRKYIRTHKIAVFVFS